MTPNYDSWRRSSPRIETESMCWEIVNNHSIGTVAVDLSTMGVRIERPYLGGATIKETQLELEIPEIDELMWAKAEATFDTIAQNNSPAGGPMSLVRRTGYRLVAAANRDLNRLKEYVIEADRARRKRWYKEARQLVARGAMGITF
ncbi:hypothetical protein BH11MYX2_BH11MYX2_31400 [soil metagenome]